jgi:hypothetical protein
MDVRVGDRIAVETERVGQPAREGEVLEVIQVTAGVSIRVRWSDGHESIFRPAAGAVRVLTEH